MSINEDVPADRLSTAEVAEACETTPRLLRQFLRDDKRYVRDTGQKGARYDFDPKKLNEMKRHFKAWDKACVDDIEKRRASRLEAARAATENEAAVTELVE